MAKRSFYVKDSELDEYQVKVINRRTDNSFIVRGCAGSGKSILALWKVKQIQEANLGTYYFIVFTKVLRQYMADGIKEIGLNPDRVVYHWEWQNKLGTPCADYIIVDEAQDFSHADINQFRAKAKKALLLYGDSAQQLYKFRKDNPPVSLEAIADSTKIPMEQLVFNHRLPKRIARVAEVISDVDDDLENRCKNEGTELPKILQYPSLSAQLDAIADIIRNRHYEDVGIFFRHNDQVENAYNYLKSKGLTVERKSKKALDLDFGSDNPKLATYHSAKGLQFEAVFLPDCSVSDNEDRIPLYVAVTRSYQSLYIMHSGNCSPFFHAVPTNLYETSLQTSAPAQLID